MEIDNTAEAEKSVNNSKETTAQLLARKDDLTVREWLEGLSSKSNIKVRIERLEPKTWKGRKTFGMLHETTELIDENEIKERWRGGKYRVEAKRKNDQGKWVFAGERTIDIAGDPLLTNDLFDDSQPDVVVKGENGNNTEDVSLQKHLVNTMERITTEDRKRAERAESELRNHVMQPPGPLVDPTLMQALTGPFQTQIAMLTESLKEMRMSLNAKDEKINELITKKPETTMQDRILEKMVDGESARILSLRDHHDTELRQLRATFEDERKRLQDHYLDEFRSKEKAQDREISTIRSAHDSQVGGMKLAYDARIDGLQAQIKTLERELDATKKELAELRAKRETPIEEQVQRIAVLSEALTSLRGGSAEAEEVPAWMQVMEKLSPIVEGVGARLTSGPQAMGQAMPPGPPPVQQIQQQAQPPKKKVRPQETSQVTISAADLSVAIQFIENAARNRTDPEMFVQSARNMIPGVILGSIRTHGVDAFLDACNLPEGSYLTTQAGRDWARKVAKLLVESQTE